MHWSARNLSLEGQAEERAILGRPGARHLTTLALYWLDGRRTLLEVADLVEAESGQRDLEALMRFAALLESRGVVEAVGGQRQ
jgi:hypothetical protein